MAKKRKRKLSWEPEVIVAPQCARCGHSKNAHVWIDAVPFNVSRHLVCPTAVYTPVLSAPPDGKEKV